MAPALAAVLVLAACGSSDDSSAPVDTPTEQPSESTAPAGDGLRAPTPVEVVSGGSNGATASAESAPAAADSVGAATSDMRIAQWVAEYVVGDGMPALPTDDQGYVFDSSVAITAEQVAAIAAALGVTGEPVHVDDMSWQVGPDDGSAPSLWVYDDGQQNWSYSSAWANASVGEGCAVAVDSTGTETGSCPEPEPPAGVLTADQAEQRSSELLSALGVDPATVTYETYADEWFASVQASDGIDGRATVRSWNFGFGEDGVLQYAGGSLAAAQPVGPYPLVDLDTAVARLSDNFYGGFGGVAMLDDVAVSA